MRRVHNKPLFTIGAYLCFFLSNLSAHSICKTDKVTALNNLTILATLVFIHLIYLVIRHQSAFPQLFKLDKKSLLFTILYNLNLYIVLIMINVAAIKINDTKLGLITSGLLLLLCFLSFFVVHLINKLDELWKKIITNSSAFAGLATGFSCLAFSFLSLSEKFTFTFQAEWTCCGLGFFFIIGFIYYKFKY